MKIYQLIMWAQHGVDLDEALGLIETSEKTAEILMKIAHLPLVNTFKEKQMYLFEGRFSAKTRKVIYHKEEFSVMASSIVLNKISYQGKGGIAEIPADLKARGEKKVFVWTARDS